MKVREISATGPGHPAVTGLDVVDEDPADTGLREGAGPEGRRVVIEPDEVVRAHGSMATSKASRPGPKPDHLPTAVGSLPRHVIPTLPEPPGLLIA